MKLNLENLSTPIEGGIIPALELARACGLNVGKPGKRRYKSWSITFDGIEHINVESPKYSERFINIWLFNGDIDVYHKVDDKTWESTTYNQGLINRVYSAFGFEITYDKWQDDMIDNIISAKRSVAASDYERGFKDGWDQASSQGINEAQKYQ